MLYLLRKSGARRRFVQRLQDQLVTRARAPVFFEVFGVPDTFDGRFDLMTFHAWMVLEQLSAAGLKDAAQKLTDAIFSGFDEALREQGVGDMGMGRRMKAIADAFYGRLQVYSRVSDAAGLATALRRNLYRGQEGPADALAAYGQSARAALACAPVELGELEFGPLPQAEP